MLVVTGGTGFIGSVLVAALNGAGPGRHLDRGRLRGRTEVEEPARQAVRGRRVARSVRAPAHSGRVRRQTGRLLHMGAISTTSFTDVDELYVRNVRYTRTLAHWARAQGVRLVYASSASVYGDGGMVSPTTHPDGADAADEPVCVLQVAFGHRGHPGRLDRIGHRPALLQRVRPQRVPQGPASVRALALRQSDPESGQIKLFQSHKEGYADGAQARDFVYVKDVCAVVLWFLDHPETSGIFNVGTEQARTFNDLAAAIFAPWTRRPTSSTCRRRRTSGRLPVPHAGRPNAPAGSRVRRALHVSRRRRVRYVRDISRMKPIRIFRAEAPQPPILGESEQDLVGAAPVAALFPIFSGSPGIGGWGTPTLTPRLPLPTAGGRPAELPRRRAGHLARGRAHDGGPGSAQGDGRQDRHRPADRAQDRQARGRGGAGDGLPLDQPADGVGPAHAQPGRHAPGDAQAGPILARLRPLPARCGPHGCMLGIYRETQQGWAFSKPTPRCGSTVLTRAGPVCVRRFRAGRKAAKDDEQLKTAR